MPRKTTNNVQQMEIKIAIRAHWNGKPNQIDLKYNNNNNDNLWLGNGAEQAKQKSSTNIVKTNREGDARWKSAKSDNHHYSIMTAAD